MITMREACEMVMNKHPNDIVLRVGESDAAFECVRIRKEWNPHSVYGFLDATLVYKEDGRIEDDLLEGEKMGFDPDKVVFHGYEEIQSLMND